jgi:purine-nucleoside phosphorylase
MIQQIADFLLSRTSYRPRVGIICGSGLGHLAETVENAEKIPYEDIPNFPVSGVQGEFCRQS